MINLSSKKVFTLLLFIISSFALKAQTNVSGFISANTTWTLAGSPYIVVSNALVSQGVTLTINPGVVVKLDSGCALQVDGEMIAIGTDSSRITFTSNKAIPKPGDWAELHFSDYAVNATFDNSGNYLSGCIMKYCDVLYGGGLNNPYGEVHIESSSPYFSRCNFNYSAWAGVYCNGSACVIDSSAVDSCGGYGFYFSNVTLNPCGLTIRSDTIKNSVAGIYLENGNAGCRTIINNNYFISNGPLSTLEAFANITQMRGNYFINNNGSYGEGLVSISGDNLLISSNSFINNIDSDPEGGNPMIVSIDGDSAIISDNSFINNSITSFSADGGGIIAIQNNYGTDTIRCNLFLNNQISSIDEGSGCIYAQNNANIVISYNAFDGNVNNFSSSSASVAWISNSLSITFTNNTIRNNSDPSGDCFHAGGDQTIHIEYNDFSNNSGQSTISLTGNPYMKHNNLVDPNAQYELYNYNSFGSPDIYADSNYWGSTNTAHVDSVIYDYFDNSNLSVVYYEPILTAPVVIDTTCSGGIPTGIKIVDETLYSTAFPNPFSTSTEVIFGKELRDGELVIYDVFGQQERVMEHINGDRVMIEKGNLSSGVYIYEVLDKQGMVGNGKLVVE